MKLRLLPILLMELHERRSKVTIPAPSGSFTVGRRCFHWVDSARQEDFSQQPEAKRELLVWIWYPALADSASKKAPYLPEEWSNRLRELDAPLPRPLSSIAGNALENAPVATADGPFPVLIFSPGLQALPVYYSALMEELASHGYVVVGISGPYTPPLVRFPNGKEIAGNEAGQCAHTNEEELIERKAKLLSVWISDMRFAIDQIITLQKDSTQDLSKIIDSDLIGAFGHSFGGVTAIQVSMIDARVRSSICMDGWFAPVDDDGERQVDKSFLYLAAGGAQREHRGRFSDGWKIKVAGFVHSSFGDGPLFVSSRVQREISKITGVDNNPMGTIDGARSVAITRHCVLSFFDATLKNKTTFFNAAQTPFPETSMQRLPVQEALQP